MSKEKLYKTAYSPMFNCFVRIDHVHFDDNGKIIFTCSNKEQNIKEHLFRKEELTRFCL